jgi:hypothetical protein
METSSNSTLKGYRVPLTPQGKSTLVQPPPWHYSSDCMAIEYWANPEAVAALLPPGLTPDKQAEGHAFFWFLDWQFTGNNDEVTDPARYQYREVFVLIDAMYENTPVTYCPYIIVDNDAAIARGWAQGFPKKLGSVFQTRTFAAPSPAALEPALRHMENVWQLLVFSLKSRFMIRELCSIGRPRSAVIFRSW